MTAPTINGTRYPQPVDALVPQARKLVDDLGEIPSRNRLMREFRIGAPKADELRSLLLQPPADEPRWTVEQVRDAFGIDPEQAERVHSVLSGTGDPWAAAEPPVDPSDYAEPIGPDPLPAPVVPESVPLVQPAPEVPAVEPVEQVTPNGHPDTPTPTDRAGRAVVWPVVLLALPAFVAVWSGWVGLGKLTGFGMVDLLPGIVEPGSWATIDSAITLPVGVETYAAYALYIWLSGQVPDRARRFARWSAIGSLIVGALGQVAYHLLVAAGVTSAPWQITTAVACLPVAVLGMGAALAHLVREDVTK